MIRRVIPFTCAVFIGLGGLSGLRAQSIGIDIPPGAQHIGHQVFHLQHPCTSDHSKTCTAIVTMDAYKVSQPLPAPPGASVSSPGSILHQIWAEHPGTSLTVSMTRGALLFHRQARLASGCTGCGGPWSFGCPANIYEHVAWDEQSYSGIPLYHVAQDEQDAVNCQSAWTIWRNPSCATYVPFWACQPPAQGAYFDGYNHVDWVNTPLHYNPVPYLCENDEVYTRTYTSARGVVTAYATRTLSGC